MSKKLVYPRCPIRTTLDLLGGKWRLLIIQQLSLRDARFSELRKAIPEISEKMLVQELHNLHDNWLIDRIEEGDSRYSYTLSEKGKLAIPLIEAMKNFGLEYTKLCLSVAINNLVEKKDDHDQ